MPRLKTGRGTFRLFTEGDHLYEAMLATFELVLAARDPDLGDALRAQYRRDLLDADEIRPSAWRARAWSERGLEMVGRTLRRLL